MVANGFYIIDFFNLVIMAQRVPQVLQRYLCVLVLAYDVKCKGLVISIQCGKVGWQTRMTIPKAMALDVCLRFPWMWI